jgi:hypothetical protein
LRVTERVGFAAEDAFRRGIDALPQLVDVGPRDAFRLGRLR